MRSRLFVPCCIALGLAPGACKDDKGSAREAHTPAPSVGSEANVPALDAPMTVPETQGPTGRIEGSVTLTGDVPEMPMLQMASDPACATSETRAETILVNEDGGLRNALVRITTVGLASPPPASPVEIDQTGCMYRPRVQGGVRGQAVEITNSDTTNHNVHARALAHGSREATETIANKAQPPNAPLRLTLGDEPIFALKCDIHAWMQGFVVVSDNSWFATTDSAGAFALDGVPVGEHALEVWHEFYGVKKGVVVVEEGKTARFEASYDAQADHPSKK